MTENRTTELLPCPFCGSEAEFNIYNTTCLVECSKCRIGTPHHLIEEYEKAIAAWNARAGRTCRIVEYDEAPYPVCSECGAVQPDDYTVYFCWNCGAKVRDA